MNTIRTILIRQLIFTFGICMMNISIHAQIPLFNSYPQAHATVYLDFDGQYVEGTIWNQNGPIDAQPAGLSIAAMTEIFNRIAADYRPFNINITTDVNVYNNAPVLQRTRIIITPSSYWYRNSAGASCIGSFTWGDDTPAWVFNNLLGDNPKYIAACASHEIGHTLGLQHQSIYDANCHKLTEYNAGTGSVETGWAPIMGIGYYKNCITWCIGSCAAGCDSIQSDLKIIAGSPNNFGFRPDDYGDDYTKASPINIYSNLFSIKGVINHNHDRDAFRLDLDSRKEVLLNVMMDNIAAGKKESDIIKISLLNRNADTIRQFDGLKLLYEGIDIILDPGTYYLVVEDAINKPGIHGFYSLSGTLVPDGALRQFALRRPGTNNP